MMFWIGIIMLAISFGLNRTVYDKIKYLKDFYELSDDELSSQIRLCNEWTGWDQLMLIGSFVLFICGAGCEILGMIFWKF
jgi:hypothetical protein